MSPHETEVNERSALLKDDDTHESLHGSIPGPAIAIPSKDSLTYIRWGCILLNFLVEMCDMIVIVPTIALLERSLCRTYYSIHDPSVIGPGGFVENERLCKISPIQENLAVLRGSKALFEALPVMLVAVPLGRIADRFGRKVVFYSSIFGSVAALLWTLLVCDFNHIFPIEMVLLSAIFLLAGNMSSANSMVYTMTADSCSEAERSRSYYSLYSVYLISQLCAPAIASATMETSLYISFGVGILFLLFCIPVLLLLPETQEPSGGSPNMPQDSMVDTENSDNVPSPRASQQTDEHQGKSMDSLLSILTQRNMLLTFGVLYISNLRPATLNVLLQYVTVRFHWKTSEAAVLMSEVAMVNIILFLFIVPAVNRWIFSPQMHVRHDKVTWSVVFASLSLLATGALLIGLAPSIRMVIPAVIVFAAGFGSRVSAASLATVWSSPDVRAQVWGTIQIVENIGKLTLDPILLRIFAASLSFSETWMGLPFFVAAGVCSLGAFAWSFVRLI